MFAAAATGASEAGLDPAWVGMFYLAGRFLLAVILAFGGIYALKKGFELIVTHVGNRKDAAKIELWRLKASVGTVGSIVMITASLWGYMGYKALPTSTEFAGLKVALLDSEILDGEQGSPELSTGTPRGPGSVGGGGVHGISGNVFIRVILGLFVLHTMGLFAVDTFTSVSGQTDDRLAGVSRASRLGLILGYSAVVVMFIALSVWSLYQSQPKTPLRSDESDSGDPSAHLIIDEPDLELPLPDRRAPLVEEQESLRY